MSLVAKLGNRLPIVARLENSWRIYTDIQRQIRYADRKVQILLAIGLAIISFTLSHFEKFVEVPTLFRIPLFLVVIGSSVSFFTTVLLALFARGSATQCKAETNLIFFGHIVQYPSAEEYAYIANDADPKILLEDLHQQIFTISQIAVEKYRYYKRSWLALLGILFPVMFLLLIQAFY